MANRKEVLSDIIMTTLNNTTNWDDFQQEVKRQKNLSKLDRVNEKLSRMRKQIRSGQSTMKQKDEE